MCTIWKKARKIISRRESVYDGAVFSTPELPLSWKTAIGVQLTREGGFLRYILSYRYKDLIWRKLFFSLPSSTYNIFFACITPTHSSCLNCSLVFPGKPNPSYPHTLKHMNSFCAHRVLCAVLSGHLSHLISLLQAVEMDKFSLAHHPSLWLEVEFA